MPVYWVKADVPCRSLYWQIVSVDSIAVTVPMKFLTNQQDYLILIRYTGVNKIIIALKNFNSALRRHRVKIISFIELNLDIFF